MHLSRERYLQSTTHNIIITLPCSLHSSPHTTLEFLIMKVILSGYSILDVVTVKARSAVDIRNKTRAFMESPTLWLQFLEWPELFLFSILWYVLLKESLYTAFHKKLIDRWLEQYAVRWSTHNMSVLLLLVSVLLLICREGGMRGVEEIIMYVRSRQTWTIKRICGTYIHTFLFFAFSINED